MRRKLKTIQLELRLAWLRLQLVALRATQALDARRLAANVIARNRNRLYQTQIKTRQFSLRAGVAFCLAQIWHCAKSTITCLDALWLRIMWEHVKLLALIVDADGRLSAWLKDEAGPDEQPSAAEEALFLIASGHATYHTSAGYTGRDLAPAIKCRDAASLSVQASPTAEGGDTMIAAFSSHCTGIRPPRKVPLDPWAGSPL